MEERLRLLVERLLDEGKGLVVGVAISSREGLPIMHVLPEDIDPEKFSAATTAIISVVNSFLKESCGEEIKRVDVEMGNGKHLIVNPVGECVLAVLTEERPSLGLIYLLIKRYCRELEDMLGERLIE